jgi:hypothetical protein
MTDKNFDIRMHPADHLEIDVLLARYTAFGDAGRILEFLDLFVQEGVLDVARQDFVGRTAIHGFISASSAALNAIPGLLPGAHHVSSRLTERVSADSARSQSVFLFVGASGPDHWGTYRDVVVRTDQGWRIARRSVRFTAFAPHSGAKAFVETLAR